MLLHVVLQPAEFPEVPSLLLYSRRDSHRTGATAKITALQKE